MKLVGEPIRGERTTTLVYGSGHWPVGSHVKLTMGILQSYTSTVQEDVTSAKNSVSISSPGQLYRTY